MKILFSDMSGYRQIQILYFWSVTDTKVAKKEPES